MDKARVQHPELESELQFGEDLQVALKEQGRAQLREELAAWDAAMPPLKASPSPTLTSKIRPLWWTVGAVAIAAALAFIFLIRGPQPIPQEQLLAQHVQPYPNLVVVVARAQTQSKTQVDQAFTAYEQGRFSEALSLMEGLQDSLPASTLSFYQANALMMSGAYEAAYTRFETVARIDTAPFQREALWYQALLDIQQGRIEEGKAAMGQIADTEKHPFRMDAQVWVDNLP